MLRELLNVVGGKGGGKPTYAEGKFLDTNNDYIDKLKEVRVVPRYKQKKKGLCAHWVDIFPNGIIQVASLCQVQVGK